MKIRFFILFFFLLLFLNIAYGRYYEISSVEEVININEDGSIGVKENITFDFHGCFSFIYRDIPLKIGERIENFSISSESGGLAEYAIIESVFSSKLLFNSICDSKKNITVNYTFWGVPFVYNDISDIHFKVWGKWDVDIKNFNVSIIFKSEPVEFYIHPFYGLNYERSNTSFFISSIPAGQWIEFRALLSEDYFSDEVNIINKNQLEGIKWQESFHKFANLLIFLLYKIAVIFVAVPIIASFIIYWTHGREPRVMYDSPYERTIPTSHQPAVVIGIFNSMRAKSSFLNAFIGTILSLVNKKWIKLESVKKVRGADFVILFKGKGDELADFEKLTYDFIKQFSVNNKLFWNTFRKNFEESAYNVMLNKFLDVFKSEVGGHFKSYDFFVSRGFNAIIGFSIGYIALMIIISGVYFTPYGIPALNFLPYSIISIIFAVITLFLPKIVHGRRTEEGMLFDKKWSAFERFLNDFSLLKTYPPESIKIWGEYLTYAVALGNAKSVIKAMKLFMPENNDFYPIVNYHLFYMALAHSYSAGTPKSSSVSFGGGGGFGGGSGGGSGGAG